MGSNAPSTWGSEDRQLRPRNNINQANNQRPLPMQLHPRPRRRNHRNRPRQPPKNIHTHRPRTPQHHDMARPHNIQQRHNPAQNNPRRNKRHKPRNLRLRTLPSTRNKPSMEPCHSSNTTIPRIHRATQPKPPSTTKTNTMDKTTTHTPHTLPQRNIRSNHRNKTFQRLNTNTRAQ